MLMETGASLKMHPEKIVFWGRLGADTNIPDEFEILRTFTLKKNAPAGIGAGARTL
jgi:hypothetical protein